MSAVPEPPPGGDESRGPAIVGITWALTVLSILIVGARLWGRARLTRNPGRDDISIVVSLVFGFAYAIFVTIAVGAGNGRHQYYLGLAGTEHAIKWNSIAFIPGIISLALPKLAVALLLIRLLNPSKWQRWFMYFITISCIIAFVLCAMFLWVQCTPTEGLWNPTIVATCWNPSVLVNYAIFCGAYSAFVDFYLAVYPMTVLRGLNINTKKKIGLALILGFGTIASIIAIYKCTTLNELYNHTDYTYATADLLILASVECNVIIIAACLPTLRPVFLFLTGQASTDNGPSAQYSHNRRSNYKLHSVSKDSRRRPDPKSAYATDTVDLVHEDSLERDVPPNGIMRTYDVEVQSAQSEAQPQPGWANGGNKSAEWERKKAGWPVSYHQNAEAR